MKNKPLKIFLIVIIWNLIKYTFLTSTDGLGFKAHKLCIDSVESLSKFNHLHSKILCSDNSKLNFSSYETSFYQLFTQIGLVHLLVASGTHLNIINSAIKIIFKSNKLLTYPFLLLFVLMSDFCCPITRCFTQLIASDLSKKFSMGWSSTYLVFISSLIYLLLFPESIISLSFWLSLSASLFLTLFNSNNLITSMMIYIGLLPFIFDFVVPDPVAILANVTLTPILSPILIGNSFFTGFIKPLYLITDPILILLTKILTQFQIFDFNNLNPKYINSYYKYLYGFLIVLISLFLQNLKTRKYKYEIKKL